MEIDKLLVIIGGVAGIGFIWWFFLGKKDEAVELDSVNNGGGADILVDGGYKPTAIKVIKGKEVSLKILRKDKNSCLEEIVIPEYKIRKYLPIGEIVELKFTPKKEGTFRFQCGMSMFHGKIIVE